MGSRSCTPENINVRIDPRSDRRPGLKETADAAVLVRYPSNRIARRFRRDEEPASRRRSWAFVKRDHFGQIQIDERIGIDHDKTAVLQECFGLKKTAAGIEKLRFPRVHDV